MVTKSKHWACLVKFSFVNENTQFELSAPKDSGPGISLVQPLHVDIVM